METNENALSAFSDETLNEMAMENLEGGIADGNTANKGCPITTNTCPNNNVAGCGCSISLPEKSGNILE